MTTLTTNLAGFALIAFVLAGCSPPKESTSDQTATAAPAADDAPPPPAPELHRPPSEVAFIKSVSDATAAYGQAENDMAKGGTRAQRKAAICAALKHHAASGWAGHIEKLSSNSEGKGVLEIDLDDGVTLKTWNNALSDASDDTLIDPSSPLFRQVSKLQQGDAVQFSGEFFDDDTDCVRELSFISLESSMTKPEFLMKFTAVKKTLR